MMHQDFALLRELCSIHAPSGEEGPVRDFLISYINSHSHQWACRPQLYYGEDLQDCLILVFGEPKAAIFTHMDSIGFSARYNRQLVKIGGPVTEAGFRLIAKTADTSLEATLKVNDKQLFYDSDSEVPPGTSFTFFPDWREDEESVQCCYMDNRLGLYTTLMLAETMRNGIICYSCQEETGGGSVEMLARWIFEKYHIKQSLICDITWVTEGVKAGEGCVVSLRDSGIPRKVFVQKIIELSKASGLLFQSEVESSGGSDGLKLMHYPYPIDWCFIGAPEEFVHSPDEKVHKKDIESMIALYRYLMDHL